MAYLDQFLSVIVRHGGSDLHFAEGQPPKMRVHGDIMPIRAEPISHEEAESRRAQAAEARALLATAQLDLEHTEVRAPISGRVSRAFDEWCHQNAHWLDTSSAAALAFAARRLRDERVALLLAERPGDGPRLSDALAEDRLLGGMQGLLAEYERAKILDRTRRGMPPCPPTGCSVTSVALNLKPSARTPRDASRALPSAAPPSAATRPGGVAAHAPDGSLPTGPAASTPGLAAPGASAPDSLPPLAPSSCSHRS